MRRLIQVLITGLVLISGVGHAHLLNMTEMTLRVVPGDTSVLVIRIDLGQSLLAPEAYWEAISAPKGDQLRLLQPAITTLEQNITVTTNGMQQPIRLNEWQLRADSLEAIRNPLTPQMATLEFQTGALAGETVELNLSPALQIPWPCLLRVDLPGGVTPVSRLLTDDVRNSRPISLKGKTPSDDTSILVRLAEAFQGWAPSVTWVAVGFQHIIPMGLDHIGFILGLFFLTTKVSTLFWQVTCFTLAHTLTLGLASLGIVNVPAHIIEPLIALSIVYVALDNLYHATLARLRLLVVTLFGLLHGLGFASALSAMQLPEDNFLSSLLLFNLGVELGQVAVLVIAFAAVGWLRNWSGYGERVARPATLTIAGAGMYWLIKRVVF